MAQLQSGEGWVERNAPAEWGYAIWVDRKGVSIQVGAHETVRGRLPGAAHDAWYTLHDGAFWSYGGIPRRLPGRSDEGPWVKTGR